MNAGRPVLSFDLRTVLLEEDGQEWVVFSYATDGEGSFPRALSPAERDVPVRVP